jgi:hypothetical protein
MKLTNDGVECGVHGSNGGTDLDEKLFMACWLALFLFKYKNECVSWRAFIILFQIKENRIEPIRATSRAVQSRSATLIAQLR